MDLPDYVNLMELVIAILLILHIVGKFPDFAITILGVILLVDVILDVISG